MSDKELHKKLDEIALRRTIHRKVSTTRTEECQVWVQYDQLWEESDERLRQRLKAMLEQEKLQ